MAPLALAVPASSMFPREIYPLHKGQHRTAATATSDDRHARPCDGSSKARQVLPTRHDLRSTDLRLSIKRLKAGLCPPFAASAMKRGICNDRECKYKWRDDGGHLLGDLANAVLCRAQT